MRRTVSGCQHQRPYSNLSSLQKHARDVVHLHSCGIFLRALFIQKNFSGLMHYIDNWHIQCESTRDSTVLHWQSIWHHWFHHWRVRHCAKQLRSVGMIYEDVAFYMLSSITVSSKIACTQIVTFNRSLCFRQGCHLYHFYFPFQWGHYKWRAPQLRFGEVNSLGVANRPCVLFAKMIIFASFGQNRHLMEMGCQGNWFS